jgi:formylglycine-generating enzyme required for sulfatase activity
MMIYNKNFKTNLSMKEFFKNFKKQKSARWLSIIGLNLATIVLIMIGIQMLYAPDEGTKKKTKKEESIEQKEQYKRETETLDIEMIFVEGGTFMMGCTKEQDGDCILVLYNIGLGKDMEFDWERPAHQVTVSSFNIGKYEVTQAQWVAVMGKNPSRIRGNNLPVHSINWYDAQEFISKLNELTGKQYRLPTEAEWEFAARGGNKSQGYKYSGSNTVTEVATPATKLYRVGSLQPNELGIYNMSGNVAEWCSDWFEFYSSDAKTNPQGPSTSDRRVVRGGGINDKAQSFRVSSRFPKPPDRRFQDDGLRLVHP